MLKLQRSQWFGFIGALEWNLHLMTQTSKEIELVGKSALVYLMVWEKEMWLLPVCGLMIPDPSGGFLAGVGAGHLCCQGFLSEESWDFGLLVENEGGSMRPAHPLFDSEWVKFA